jgi:hypothetical protein
MAIKMSVNMRQRTVLRKRKQLKHAGMQASLTVFWHDFGFKTGRKQF